MFWFLLSIVPVLFVACGSADSTVQRAPSAIDHVIVMSVDGLRPELLQAPLIAKHPSMARLLRGPHTLEARTDPDSTVTLPNHVGMATGRLFAGPTGHNWLGNSDPPEPGAGGTLSEMHGEYVASMFDVANDHGFATTVVASKTKFILFDQSYDEAHGALDTVGADDGCDKIDVYTFRESCTQVAAETLKFIHDSAAKGLRSLSFTHFSETDIAGHAGAWDLADETEYRKAAVLVDSVIGALLAGIESDPTLRGRVAIVLTSDHGGGVPPRSHTDPKAPINFTIPFCIWMGIDQAPVDLYEINRTVRVRPSTNENPRADVAPPIRNADAGNLALMILGLQAIPKSAVNAAQDLRVAPKVGTTDG